MLFALYLTSFQAHAQRYLPGMKALQVTAGMADGVHWNANTDFAYHIGAAYSVYTKNANRWVIGGEYLHKKYDYKDMRIPVEQFTAEGGYYLKFLSDRRKTCLLYTSLEMLFQAAGLIIDTLRTFFLIVLSILGPLAFAISVYDGFQSTLTRWISRYISIYLWLPVSDLFSSVLARIQTLMLQKDIEQLSDPDFIPDGSSTVYIIFMIIGIVGYFTIPSVAGWVVSAGGTSAYSRNVTRAGAITGAVAGAATGKVAGKLLK